MNPAELTSCQVIEATLGGHKAFRKVDEQMYVVKQGSSYVMITVVPWGQERAIVRCVAQLVKGARMTGDLAINLLTLNANLRFGAFGFVEEGSLVVLLHSVLGGGALSPGELMATVRDIALLADEWDDKIISHFGGQRMQDLLEEQALARVLSGEWRIGLGEA